MAFLFNSPDAAREAVFRARLTAAFPDLPFLTARDDVAPEAVRFIFTWAPLPDWGRFPNLEAVFSVSAGVDQFAGLPREIPLIRMQDPMNTRRVVEYVTTSVLACLRDLPVLARCQRERNWAPDRARLIADTSVGILGLGAIGLEAARMLSGLGFRVAGWALSPGAEDGVARHTGAEGLDTLLAASDIVVCLLPLTPATEGILNADLFARMRPGASLVHAGRGRHCVDADLAAALSSGRLRSAVIDVFDVEPLPADDARWDLPNCLVTPHVAGRIAPETAVENVAENLARHARGLPLLWQVDRDRGY
ncbi:glyoxylate/hydroxypyruvate reductase A [Paroceanicella profunda]|uniref:Glyoxylate/hydroxypyruvate reductase A n=1 Tax=Paroceanicella profunda TaxID=2579971 RepID=A0A5B8G003_9RHOB|nr:glyoxylate/hydroxypyruvate reductase A [Paroceanicella profunda]QDL93334.1 glyoxylate/hydroxypyruvate reductase A [Paroceanicella profunda]